MISIDERTSLPSLRTLKISCITVMAYKTVLGACPNLVRFEFSIFSSDQLNIDIEPHVNLKRLSLDIVDVIWPWHDLLFDNCLSCVPNLEKFDVYRSVFVSKITESLLEYDWLASKITLYLSLLYRFNFYLKVIQSQTDIDPNTENILCQIKETFLNKHHDKYQSRHVICR